MKVGTRYLHILAAGWAATWSASSCAFPNYGFEDEVKPGLGGHGNKPLGPSSGSGSGADDSGGEGGHGGSAEAPVIGGGGGGGGVASPDLGEGGDGGEAGSNDGEPVIKVCADFESFPADCQCFDYREHAYLYCSVARNWKMAGLQCGFHEMRLVALDDIAENTWLHDKVMEITHSSFPYFWIGASSGGDPAVWSWPNEVEFWEGGTDGELVGRGYAGWRGGNPDAGAGACAFMGQEGWEDGGCTDSRPYACESY